MIWRFACTAPQIHVIACGEKGSRANVNKVMNACTEAKSVGLALQLDYFCFHTYYNHTDPRYPGLVKYFVNADVDTFWILPIAEKVSFPDDIDWYCGKCDQLFYIKDPRPCSRCESFSRFNMPQGIHSLALDFMIWHEPDICEPDIYDLPKGTMELCMRYDVKELLLVVGYYAPVPSERDPALVAPCQSPPLTWLHLSQELDLPPTRDLQILESAKPIWQDLEESLARQIEEIREQRAKDRQAAIDCKCAWNELHLLFNTSVAGEASSFEQIDSYTFERWHELRDLSKWTPPKFKFVEAW